MLHKHTVPVLKALLLCSAVMYVCSSAAAILTMEMLYRYVQQGNLRQLAAYFQNSPSLELQDRNGNTALCQAVINQDQMTVRKLIYLGANKNAACMYRIPTEKLREAGVTPRATQFPSSYVQASKKTAGVPALFLL